MIALSTAILPFATIAILCVGELADRPVFMQAQESDQLAYYQKQNNK